MLTYNDELRMLCDWYLRYCKDKELNPNLLTNIFLFIKETSIEQYYHNYGEVVNDLIEEMKTHKPIVYNLP